ncbi:MULTISPECIES: hypothetical protein [unclassified Sphingomonas]|uniref:hypothetical protein n=1 Tax=unclassified Sphingomonas TaxID=196159 RepID=UPI0009258B41|nr:MULTISPECIES: hypothetical protein [unclassified Sphingomonas]OJU19356.1 MAG: hypothetical protein BGN95_13205 [Sphingomonas sp. 66-10]
MTAFAYHRAIAPMLWVFAGLASIELVVVHLLVSFWHPRVALVLSLVSLAGLVWLIWAIALMRRRPVEIAPDALLMRTGGFKQVRVPLDMIAAVTAAGNERDRSALNLALIAHPNVLVELRAPLRGRRAARRIAHRLDDPQGFIVALETAISRHSREGGNP